MSTRHSHQPEYARGVDAAVVRSSVAVGILALFGGATAFVVRDNAPASAPRIEQSGDETESGAELLNAAAAGMALGLRLEAPPAAASSVATGVARRPSEVASSPPSASARTGGG
ncbi:MAG: hypothetical protein LW847_06580 [Burkholderiales bacterium]|jgi:hypothetical protein|nr:hypothetical protein [Burkholderiales bacterium]